MKVITSRNVRCIKKKVEKSVVRAFSVYMYSMCCTVRSVSLSFLKVAQSSFLGSIFNIFGGKTITVMLCVSPSHCTRNDDNIAVLISHICIEVWIAMVHHWALKYM